MDTVTCVWMDYDEAADIFYVRLRSDVKDARTDETGHGVLIDRDPVTGEIVGIEILDFLGHFAVCKDLAWLGSYGISDEILRLMCQKAREHQQNAGS